MKRILLVAFLSAIGAGLYFVWDMNHKPAVRAWDLVLDESLVVYEHHKNAPEGTNLLLRSFVPDSVCKALVEAKEFLISLHVISKKETGTVIYLPGAVPSDHKMADLLTSHRPTKERIFEGYTIAEITIEQKKIISTVVIGDVLVISSASVLIEDVVRLARSKERQNFVEHNKSIFRLAQLEPDGSRVYANLTQLPVLLRLLMSTETRNPVLDRFAKSGVVDVKSQPQGLLLSGFFLDSLADGPSALSLFNRQRPVPITLHRIISNRIGLLFHYGVSDVDAWSVDRLAYGQSQHYPIADSVESLKSRYAFEADLFYKSMGSEMGRCQSGIYLGDIFIVAVKDKAAAEKELRKLHRRNKTDTASAENYSHYQIHSLVVSDAVTSLFWPLTDHPMNYYTAIDQHVIFAENLDDMKAFVTDLDGDNTWGKSSEWNKFLSAAQETNAGVVFDALNGWPSLRARLDQKWKSFGDSTHLFNIGKGSFQFSRLEKSYYFNGSMQFNTGRSAPAREQKEKYIEAVLPGKIRAPLTVVKNHKDGTSELIAQDDGNNLLLLSPKLKTLFSTKVDGVIRTEIHQIDIYKNKKLQYVFATENKIWLVDRLGNTVTGFPKLLGEKTPIRFLAIVDHDNARNYQFLVADAKGTISLYTRDGKAVPGWKTIEIHNDLWVAPRYIRNNGKDFLVAITEDGVIYGFDKSGAPLDGFPVTTKVRPQGNWVFDKSNGVEVIMIVGNSGELVLVDLKGKIVSKSNLVRSSASSRFSLVTTVAKDHFVISRIDQDKVAVLNSAGETVFERENPGSEELFLSYFETGPGQQAYGFTDPLQEFTYFFDGKGEFIFPRPMENQLAPAVISEKAGNIYFYGVIKNRIQSYKRGLRN